MTNSHLINEFIPLNVLLMELPLAEVANLMGKIQMHGHDAFDRFRSLEKDDVSKLMTWMADFATGCRQGGEAAGARMLALNDEDAFANLNGFVLSDLVGGSPLIRAAFQDPKSKLGAILRDQRTIADELLEAANRHVELPAKFAKRVAALEAASERNRIIGLHVLRLIDAHERAEEGRVEPLNRVTLARRVFADIAQLRLTMPDGGKVGRLSGVGALSEQTIIKDVIGKYRLLLEGEATPRWGEAGKSTHTPQKCKSKQRLRRA